jgi:hypothetical protein
VPYAPAWRLERDGRAWQCAMCSRGMRLARSLCDMIYIGEDIISIRTSLRRPTDQTY